MTPPIHPTSVKRRATPRGFAPDTVARVLAMAQASPGQPPVFGIAGLQGSGKSTLAKQLVVEGKAQGLGVVAVSLDDFYLNPRERLALAAAIHPLLATRGPPGTHDLALACRTLDALRRLPIRATPGVEPLRLPQFDKRSDRRLPPSRCPGVAQRPDLIVFEGWFLGVSPQSADALVAPVNTLERDEDRDGAWRRFCNEALAHYAPLWCRIDRLLFLHGPGFEVVPDWRWQQEQALATGKHAGMTEAEVARFVRLFERISLHALATLPRVADHVIALDADRRPLG